MEFIGLVLCVPVVVGELLGMAKANRLRYYATLLRGFCRGVVAGFVAIVLLFALFAGDTSPEAGLVILVLVIPLFVLVGFCGYLISWGVDVAKWMCQTGDCANSQVGSERQCCCGVKR